MTIKQFLENVADKLLDAMRPQILHPVELPIPMLPKHNVSAEHKDSHRHSALFD